MQNTIESKLTMKCAAGIIRYAVLLGLLSAGLLAFSSCVPKSSKGEENRSAAESEVTEPEAAEPEEIETEIPGTITFDGLLFREEPGGRGTRQLDVGEVVAIVGEKKPDPENTDRIFTPIRLSDGEEGWVSHWFVIPESTPAVLTRNAKIYSEPKLSKLSTDPELEAMHIVAIGTEGDTNGFIRINYATPDGYARLDDYIKAELVSENEDDILAAHLYKLAMAAEDEGRKAEFLESASQLRSSAFGIAIKNALQDALREISLDSTAALLVVKDGAASHEAPDELSPVVASYSVNDILKTTGRSETKDIVDGIEDWWYVLESGDWVFGGFVEVTGNDF